MWHRNLIVWKHDVVWTHKKRAYKKVESSTYAVKSFPFCCLLPACLLQAVDQCRRDLHWHLPCIKKTNEKSCIFPTWGQSLGESTQRVEVASSATELQLKCSTELLQPIFIQVIQTSVALSRRRTFGRHKIKHSRWILTVAGRIKVFHSATFHDAFDPPFIGYLQFQCNIRNKSHNTTPG